jgi:hypothetical protein
MAGHRPWREITDGMSPERRTRISRIAARMVGREFPKVAGWKGDRLVSLNVVAQVLDIHPRSVERLIQFKRLRAVKQPVAGEKRPKRKVRASELADYLNRLEEVGGEHPNERREPPRGRRAKKSGIIEFI